MIIHIPLDRIQPNPWQTRQGDPDPAYIKELALDIAANGLLQIPIGQVDPATLMFDLDEDDHIKLAFGHNRLAAYKWLRDTQDYSNIAGDFSAMPVDLRQLTDEQMALMAWSENEKRRDVTPIERALAIQRRIDDFKWTQAQAAEALGISRPTVSNALRLLKLPENITTALADGRISERVAMALAGFYDLPEPIRRAASNSWYTPADLVREALEGKLTSDAVREKIDQYCKWFGIDLAKAPFALDDPFMIPDVHAPFCRDCELRYAHRNLCLDKDCYQRKLDSFRLTVLQRAADACGIPPHDNLDAKDYEYTSFRIRNEAGALETILAGKCPNLRLRYSPVAKQIPDHPDAEIVCSKREQFCHCLAGLRASQPTKTGHYDYEKREYETIIDAPLVQLDAEQPTAEDLHNAAKAARQANKQIELAKQAALQDAVERIAVALTSGKLEAWKWLARKMNYSLDKKVEQIDNVFDVRAAMAAYGMAGMTYPMSLVKCIKILNEVLAECNVDPLDLPVSEQPAGKSLVDVFEDHDAP
jgi:ParB/RepB/Spo0J family partition protein